ncbi:MAG: acetolactate decarboxylase [Coriobacteriales bacterium]|nr:acetolactate decarboxylase [Coriobacteriales bacterium]
MVNKMFQVSTLHALVAGYTRGVISVKELESLGDVGLGTFDGVDGEMILLDGVCYRACQDGSVVRPAPDVGVPFASAASVAGGTAFELEGPLDLDALKHELTCKIDDAFALNSMHIATVSGTFDSVSARSESAYRADHITLKDMLAQTQREFVFEKLDGTLVCVYHPDYMDGINAPGWHVHFLSGDRMRGGHVFDLSMLRGRAVMHTISRIEIQLPSTPAFDTYSLKETSQREIAEVEQGASRHSG